MDVLAGTVVGVLLVANLASVLAGLRRQKKPSERSTSVIALVLRHLLPRHTCLAAPQPRIKRNLGRTSPIRVRGGCLCCGLKIVRPALVSGH